MKAGNIKEVPKGWITNSAYTVLVGQDVQSNDDKPETILDGTFRLVEASKLSLDDEFMQHDPQTDKQSEFKIILKTVIKSGLKDFYKPIYDPSIDENGNIIFVAGKMPAVGLSHDWWVHATKKFMPKRGSRLGTKKEYIAFLGVLIKKLTANGWSVANAWKAVCDDSKMLGHYRNSENAKNDFQETGSREICGFFDLANTCKILAWSGNAGGFWVAAGCFKCSANREPMANLEFFYDYDVRQHFSVGWCVLSK